MKWMILRMKAPLVAVAVPTISILSADITPQVIKAVGCGRAAAMGVSVTIPSELMESVTTLLPAPGNGGGVGALMERYLTVWSWPICPVAYSHSRSAPLDNW